MFIHHAYTNNVIYFIDVIEKKNMETEKNMIKKKLVDLTGFGVSSLCKSNSEFHLNFSCYCPCDSHDNLCVIMILQLGKSKKYFGA